MRLTVLGGGGAYPTPARGCSGYLVEHDGFRLLVDPGYATLPVLLECLDAAEVDAVFVTHSHADHCADLNPLLRVRHLAAERPAPLDVFALSGAVDAVLALDADMILTDDCALHAFTPARCSTSGTFVDEVPAASQGLLSSAPRAAQHAVEADVGRLVLTHLRADADPAAARRCAERSYRGPVDVAEPRLVLDIE